MGNIQVAGRPVTRQEQLIAGGLYRPDFERDNCGFGLIAHMDGATSHWLVQTAVSSLGRLTHRGAVAADGKTGDGCGLLLKKPERFLRGVAAELDFKLSAVFAVGMVFLNQEAGRADEAKAQLERELCAEGLVLAGWRKVPTDASACGAEALKTLPRVEQIFVNAPEGMTEATFDRHLFMARRRTEKAIYPTDPMFYVPSLSAQVVAYKGLIMPANMPVFYPDLLDARMETSVAVFHQRFSTNTWPQWRLAQPFRFLAHNGEINTVQGNRNWALARAYTFKSALIPKMEDIRPLVSTTGSDSDSLDNMLEVLIMGGVELFRAMRLLVPPAWQNVETMDADLRAFYEYSSMHMESWDGPAGLVMTDGRYAACAMDRNGLRPARYVITRRLDNERRAAAAPGRYANCVITLASEIGVFDYENSDVISKGRLKPGQMLASDTQTGELLTPDDVDGLLKSRQPYRKWLNEHSEHLCPDLKGEVLTSTPMATTTFDVYQKMFNVTFEERDQVLRVLAESGQEAVGSMGDDTPMAVLSERVRSVYDYFRQQFAQVTNPPIDPLRESIVMSLETCFGREHNLFEETPDHAARLLVDAPVLSERMMSKLLARTEPHYAHLKIDLNYNAAQGLHSAITQVCDAAVSGVRAGKVIIVLSDRAIARDKLPIHAALATGAVHHRLIKEGLRCNANIVVETGTARDPHHFAVLIGYGATAVYPYLAYEVLHDLTRSGEIVKSTSEKLIVNYRKGINKGILKIMSKMGISTVASYRGAQLFEAIGLHSEVISLCFINTVSRLQGAMFFDLQQDQEQLAQRAWNARQTTHQGGLLKFVHGEEYHAYNPDVVTTLRTAVESGDYNDYNIFSKLVNERPVATLRDLLRLRRDVKPIPLDEVEPIEAITPRFDTAAMSLGALSPEAHEALAIAMNELGGRSNSGEGGEDPVRYRTNKMSKIKQVASGRFGVTPEYLINAEVLQIKIAQGAKPGEGGQLPGDKVNELIARLRYARPGVGLISPPPHHDIYSIEDLAQLIFDLKQVNPQALVSVKLVSEPGVGTIAAGVAKAYADLITIAGYDGGTGASPLSSVKYAGSPWELGLSETHQVLRANQLREKVRLQTDGGLKTGLDVIKGALLGAESFGFGTGPMIALGCKYLRICHLNNCATGVATQNDVLRMKHFKGLPEFVKNYFRFVARDVRECMAALGIRKFEELIGRADLLEVIEGTTAKQRQLDLSPLLSDKGHAELGARYCVTPRNAPFDKGELAETMVRDCRDAILHKKGGVFHYQVRNTHRSIGARLSGEIARLHGNKGMDDAPIELRLKGSAGQSLGVWNAGGLHIYLEGDANDYVGKGMASGKVVVYSPKNSTYPTHESPIIGNTCLYGATGGLLYAAGVAGERFAVRNSGANAVVEGLGDHGCEYMTGGCVTVLGQAGSNFGAGMTGGFSYVLDVDRGFQQRYNSELVDVRRIVTESAMAHQEHLRSVIQEHVAHTGSPWGQKILHDFSGYLPQFWIVTPRGAELETLLEMLLHAA